MSPAPDDPDFSSVDSLPDSGTGAKLPTVLDGLGTAIKKTTTDVSGSTNGRTPEAVTAATAAVAQAARTLADNAAIAEAAAKILKDAKAQWSKSWQDGGAPKKKDLDEADKAVTDARAELSKAQAAEDSAREKYNSVKENEAAVGSATVSTYKDALDKAAAATKAAREKLDQAVAHKTDLDAKRKTADEAYEAARTRAAEKLKTLKPVEGLTPQEGGSGNGFVTPDQSTGSGTPAGKGAGTGSTGGAPAAKPSGTPAATPGAKTPGSAAPATTTSGTTGSDADLIKAAAALSQGQQQPQTQQQMPTMPQVPQQATQQQPKAGEKSDLEKQAEKNGTEALTAAGLGGLVAPTVLGGSSPASPPPAVTASAPAAPTNTGPTTQLRPNFGAAAVTNAQSQLPPTTGTSQTGLHTTSDVGGRSTPAATAFSATPAGVETKTSSATDTGQGTGARPAGAPAAGAPGVGGMPVGGVAAPAASGSRRGEGGERPRIETYPDREQYLMNGGDTLSEAVPGGTIAQNRPSRDDGPRTHGRAA